MTETSPPYGDQPADPPDPRDGFAYCVDCGVRFEVMTRMDTIEHLCQDDRRVTLPVSWPDAPRH